MEQLNLTNKEILAELANVYQIKPSKDKGQNFLIEQEVVEEIIESADLSKENKVLEVGPGFGVLTFELVKKAGEVLAVELDGHFFDYWQKNREGVGLENLQILNQDILDFEPGENGFQNFDYKIVANLPYQISSPFLWKFLQEEKCKPREMIIMLQKEVGERLVAPVGKLSLLGILAQYYAEAEMVTVVKKESFWPSPKVDSMVVRLRLKKELPAGIDEVNFFKLVKIGFAQKRKKIRNNFKGVLMNKDIDVDEFFKAIEIDASLRAQDLAVADWLKIYHKFYQ